MAATMQAIVLVASSMLVIGSCSAQLVDRPSPSTTAVASAPLHLSDGVLYSMQYRIGSTEVSGVIDTGSDLIWTNNSELLDSSVSCPFDAGKEMGMTCCHGLSTFERVYGGASHVRGVMGEAKLTFVLGQSSYTAADLNIGSAVMFGCHLSSVKGKATPACKAYARGGIVGLGRGKLSLVNQLGLHNFSYCLPDHSSASQATGQIKFNDTAAPLKDTNMTKLETNNKELAYPASSRYYVGLKKIQVGAKENLVSLPNGCFEEDPSSGNGGMVIDSGSSLSSLPEEVFNAVKKHVEELIKSKRGTNPEDAPTDGHNCYRGMYPDTLDNIVLHFCDEGRMEIPAHNYFIHFEAENKFCLAFKKNKAGGKNRMSILGAYQQQGMHMLFNIEHNTLSFAKHSACGQSQEENHATMQ